VAHFIDPEFLAGRLQRRADDFEILGAVRVGADVKPVAAMLDLVTQALRARLAELTPQQLRVLELIRRGFQNKHIAVELKLAESTVKAHVTEILRKLKLFSRNKAVIEIGKIDLPTPKQQAARLERAKPT